MPHGTHDIMCSAGQGCWGAPSEHLLKRKTAQWVGFEGADSLLRSWRGTEILEHFLILQTAQWEGAPLWPLTRHVVDLCMLS